MIMTHDDTRCACAWSLILPLYLKLLLMLMSAVVIVYLISVSNMTSDDVVMLSTKSSMTLRLCLSLSGLTPIFSIVISSGRAYHTSKRSNYLGWAIH